MFSVYIFFEVLFGEIEIEPCEVNITFGLIFDNSQIFLGAYICRLCVLDAYFLVYFLVGQRTGIELDEQITFFNPFAFGNNISNGSSALYFVFEDDLVSGLDSARFDEIYSQRPVLDLVYGAVVFILIAAVGEYTGYKNCTG